LTVETALISATRLEDDPMTRLAAFVAPALAASLSVVFALATGTASANTTTKRHPHHAARGTPAAYAPQNSYAPHNSWGWGLASPNAAPISLFTYFRTHGYCVIDEGYGRATLCD
jgi:hypothetical protein